MAPSDFGTLPKGAAPTREVKPFTVHVPDEALEEMKTLVRLSKLCSPIYEGEQADRKYGVTNKWMRDAKDYWLKEFDW